VAITVAATRVESLVASVGARTRITGRSCATERSVPALGLGRCYALDGVVVRASVFACVGVVAGALLGLGCFPESVFVCEVDAECGPRGTCEPSGFCSFPDDTCPTLARYGEHAPSGVAGRCVEPPGGTGAAGPDTSPGDDPTTGGTSSDPTPDDPDDPGTGGMDDDPPSDSDDEPESVCGDGIVDSGEACDDGNALDGDGCNSDCKPSGGLLRTIRYDDGGSDDRFHAVALATGGLMLAGSTSGSGVASDGLLVRYDLEGNEIWSRAVDRVGEAEGFRGVVVGGDGTIFAVGQTAGEDAGSDVWVAAFSAEGSSLWEHVWTTTGVDTAIDVAVAGSAVYVAGCRDDRGRAFVRRMSSSGSVAWTRTFSADGGRGCAHGVFATTSAVFAAGWTSGESTGEDMWTTRLDPAGGDSIWEDVHTGIGSEDRLHDVVAAPGGDVLVVGREGDGVQRHAWVRRYGAGGDIVFTWQAESIDEVSILGAAVTPGDGVVIVGWERAADGPQTAFIEKLDAQGGSVWRHAGLADGETQSWLGGVAVLADGRIVTAGYVHEGDYDGWVGLYAP
jgi:cysteine-rich repeat protein